MSYARVLTLSGYGAVPPGLARFAADVHGSGAESATPCKPHTPIPWTCWDKPGFKECHAVAFKAAQEECEFRGLKDNDCCINTITDTVAAEVCSKECPEVAGGDNASSTLLPAVLVVAAIFIGVSLIGGKS